MSDRAAPGLVRGVRPKNIGARIKRVEDPRLLTGQGSYADDRQTPRALHVAFRRSDQSHARIVSIDTEAAAAMPGVFAVLTADDFANVPLIQATSRMKDYVPTPLRPLAKDKVRFVGEPIVAVLADSRYLAEDALEAVEITFGELGRVTDPEAAVEPGSPLLHESAGTNVLAAREFKRGDVEHELMLSAVRVKARFRMHRKTPLAMEPRSYVAEYDRGRRALTLTSSTQVPGILRDLLSEVLELPGHSVRVVAPDVGGGFGGKASLYQEEVLVSVLAKRLGRCVRWTSDRLEDLISTSQGFDEIICAEMGVDENGNILALTADVIGDVGAYSIYPWTAAIEPIQVVSFLPGPYKIANYRGRVRAVSTSKAPTGPYRGVGRPPATFAMERLIDMAARELGIDPADMRRRNLVQPHEFPYKVASGLVWDRSAFTESLEIALDAVDYTALRAAQAKARTEGRILGIGIATYAELTGIGSRISAAPGMPINTGTEQATIRLDSTGSVTGSFGVASHGQGLETTLSQVIADELGCRIEDVQILQGDSSAVAHSTGTYASRGAVIAGGAATLASRDLKQKVLRAASHVLEAAEADISVEHGIVSVSGTDRSVTFKQLAKAIYSEMGRLPKDAREEMESTKVYDPFFGTATSATHICTLEIDPKTYKIRLDKYFVAEDCGRIINPMIVDGQVHGAVAQGIGAALYEEVVYDADGQCISASLADYVVPAASEIPHIGIAHIEAELPGTVNGFRGMGEGGTIGAPAAIANALADALSPYGIEINELPVTPERLFRLMQAAQSQGE
ncbi:caffeine dehydrogenase subunit alpha [Variibacter gotjawalensis]|uniref:Caffeine dehydrogenase subunit alpha n=1 Tax=Variibacter gotjawalensis TaxID=1333996 RepID=A0A0S3Q004_9BRAD|nr:xanthine dehydrogenase family protein molybdopterin-binding subunit [Variibacter gotjawalensis]NIK47339.1 carbon-monoxide dehydrogenase large subunit [Variibacter gotjawalensis]RZS49237.1 carbon-monoxide dehydrogenase large subunit [Variibacter gotjawalensis]BAT61499.1 caffeine dehydrogenase subunit alpha [Variibacter gotjawalensis]